MAVGNPAMYSEDVQITRHLRSIHLIVTTILDRETGVPMNQALQINSQTDRETYSN